MSSPRVVRATRTTDWAGPAVALSLAATVLGLSRFGYGVLLPAMRAAPGDLRNIRELVAHDHG